MTKGLNKIWMILAIELAFVSSSWAQVTKQTLDQHADQSVGNYTATNLNYLGSGALGMTQSAWKDPLQHMGEGQSKPGYSKYYWSSDLVLPVRLREGMYTLINFPAWEVIEQVYMGDGTSFDARIEGPSSLMVTPSAGTTYLGVDTNMIVFGRSGNKYVFYVQSETVNTDRITNSIIDIEVLKKHGNMASAGYPGGTGAAATSGYSDNGAAASTYTKDLQREDWIEKIPVDPTQFRFDIEVYVPNPDDIIIAPERVWRDNIFTYIDLGEKALTAVQRPVVSLIVERSEVPVGFRSAGPNNRLIIVEGMGDMVLRSGKRMVCLKLRRADSDGLENAIYAKSNEWDLQTAYASQPGNTSSDGSSSYEDVYNTSDAQLSGEKKEESKSFFNFSSFFGGKKADTNPENNAPKPESQSFESLNKINAQSLESLPKVTTVVATPSAQKAPEMAINGQYDVKINSSEIIEPTYSNSQPSPLEVSYQKNNGAQEEVVQVIPSNAVPAAQNKNAPIIPNNVEDITLEASRIGNSSNNSSPVVISQPVTDSGKPALISKETEALLQEFRSGRALNNSSNTSISIELGTDDDVNNLERLWSDVSKKYAAALGKYEPFYSVDAPADGQGKDVFHLRVGPIKTLEEGDNICSQMGLNGIFCSVVRTE